MHMDADEPAMLDEYPEAVRAAPGTPGLRRPIFTTEAHVSFVDLYEFF